jgi:hypothetical protein
LLELAGLGSLRSFACSLGCLFGAVSSTLRGSWSVLQGISLLSRGVCDLFKLAQHILSGLP